MNFTTEPLEPLRRNVPAEYYRNVLDNYKYKPDSQWPSLHGKITIDGEPRLVKFSLDGGIVTEIEICEISETDTFVGISMSQRPKKFQKLLAQAGIKSAIDIDGIDLEDHPVSFFIEGGKLASICWK
ncbi:hypothetical protein [Corynebacterium sp. ED61]|uniref:hypothetical protein n=1 Tax=Corynebacterium TaxID=1716 RepID=UPI0018833923|nr:hypothetical protein [Corynebacterium sp. ED61]MBF0581493.1 hypothetical protein [Corynebacterium sp. ED61]